MKYFAYFYRFLGRPVATAATSILVVCSLTILKWRISTLPDPTPPENNQDHEDDELLTNCTLVSGILTALGFTVLVILLMYFLSISSSTPLFVFFILTFQVTVCCFLFHFISTSILFTSPILAHL